jgi:hypothetical protein
MRAYSTEKCLPGHRHQHRGAGNPQDARGDRPQDHRLGQPLGLPYAFSCQRRNVPRSMKSASASDKNGLKTKSPGDAQSRGLCDFQCLQAGTTRKAYVGRMEPPLGTSPRFSQSVFGLGTKK